MKSLRQGRQDSFSEEPFIFCVDPYYIPYINDSFSVEPFSQEFLYELEYLSTITGKYFARRRGAMHQLMRNHDLKFIPFEPNQTIINQCLELIHKWKHQRKLRLDPKTNEYQSIDWAVATDELAIRNFHKPGLLGATLWVDYQLGGYLFGRDISLQTHCLIVENTNLELQIQGIKPYLRKNYSENIVKKPLLSLMDDSGFENLRKDKQSYGPCKKLPFYWLTVTHDSDWKFLDYSIDGFI